MSYYQTNRAGLRSAVRSAAGSLLEARTPGLQKWSEFLGLVSPNRGDFRGITDAAERRTALDRAIHRAEQAQARLHDGSFVWCLEELDSSGRINFLVFARAAGLDAAPCKVAGKSSIRLSYKSAELRAKLAQALSEAKCSTSDAWAGAPELEPVAPVSPEPAAVAEPEPAKAAGAEKSKRKKAA